MYEAARLCKKGRGTGNVADTCTVRRMLHPEDYMKEVKKIFFPDAHAARDKWSKTLDFVDERGGEVVTIMDKMTKKILTVFVVARGGSIGNLHRCSCLSAERSRGKGRGKPSKDRGGQASGKGSGSGISGDAKRGSCEAFLAYQQMPVGY